jgi:predicted DCC family thiol-disulfide oxidoreductase YuxK
MIRPTRAQVPNPPGMPLLIFDGDCAFCRLWIERWRARLGDRVGCAPYQDAGQRFPNLPLERFRHAVQLIEPDGNVYEGAEAVFRVLAKEPGHGHWLAIYQHLPGARLLSDAGYSWVAGHRNFLYPMTRRLIGEPAAADAAAGSARRRPGGLGRAGMVAAGALGALAIGTAGFMLWKRKKRSSAAVARR